MSDKRYFTIVIPLNDKAQAMIRRESSRYQLRTMLWSHAAERMKTMLGKTCSMFSPAVKPVWCNVPLPFGVALGAVEPHEFLACYFSAQKTQGDEIHAKVQRIEAMGETVFTKQLNEHLEMAVLAVDMSDPELCREMEFANRFFKGDINPIVDQQLSVYLEESKIIREMAEKSDCVIVGRCGDHVLRDFTPFRLFFYADINFRLARCRSRADPRENMCDRDILQHIDSIDRSRARYYKFFTEHKWGDRCNYDLCVNTASVEWGKLVELLANIL